MLHANICPWLFPDFPLNKHDYNKAKAIKTLQIFIFNNLINSLQGMTDILNCYDDNEEKLELYIDKIVKIIEVLDLENEYPQALLNAFSIISLIYEYL